MQQPILSPEEGMKYNASIFDTKPPAQEPQVQKVDEVQN